MDKYYTSIVKSSHDYLRNLQYLAREDSKTLNDLFDLNIIYMVYEWSNWFKVSELDKIKLQKKMSLMLGCNSKLTMIDTTPHEYYKNVNIPQNAWTWQRIYDNLNVVIINKDNINPEVPVINPPLVDFSGNYITE